MLSAWVTFTFILFSLMRAKLPAYILPLFPGLAVLVAWRCFGGEGEDPGPALPGWIWRIVVLSPLVTIAAVPVAARVIFQVDNPAWLWLQGGLGAGLAALVIAGSDKRGTISMGVGKANAVPDAMRKASERARKKMRVVNLAGTTIPHEVLGKVAGAKVMLKPASPGTGVIAAGGVRAVLEVAGIRDILTKSQGSANVLNVVQATFDALEQLKSPQLEASRRGKPVAELTPFWERRKQNA